MTLTTLTPYIDTALATKTANSVLHRVFIDIKALTNSPEYSDSWVEKGLNYLKFSNDIEIGFAHGKATILSIFKEAWDNLPLSFRKQHGYQYINFAKIWTGGKAKSTIDAYTLTAKIWILDDYGAGKQVEIKRRSPDGKPILDERGAEITDTVEFCPYNVDLSKLNILNPRALKDDMTDALWEMLVDPFYTCDDLRIEHNKDKQDGNGHQYTLRYDLSGPALMVYQNGNSVVVAPELNWEEYESDPLVKEAIDSLLKILGVQMEEDKIFNMVKELYK
ncbi:MAG: hypothetical protein WC196_04490 [Bacilli bacterium]